MRLVLDLETSSTADLRLTGAQAYAEHSETRITVLCYAIDMGFVRRWTTGPCPADFQRAIALGAIVVAHNYLFEFNLYHQKLVPRGWPRIPLAQWSCTMARALVAGYPASLEHASRAARVPIPKNVGARELMLRMARPRSTHPEVTWWHETSPEHFERLCAYCETDVQAERGLDQALPELSPRERAIFDVDHKINQTGMAVDLPLVRQLNGLAGQARAKLNEEVNRASGGLLSSPNQVGVLRQFLATEGCPVPDLRRGTVRATLARLPDTLTRGARRVLQARYDASRSSTAKLDAILWACSQDGRVRGCFQYYGASRTGRWAGRRLQPQNLFRGSIRNVAGALHLIQTDTPMEDIDMLFEDSVMGVVASCLRSTIIAAPGNSLVVCDFAQIEARCLAWLANEPTSLAVFAAGEDIYVATARRVGSSNRQLGKVLVLACGYGMGALRFQETAASYGVSLTLTEAMDLVYAWRDANSNIVTFWWDCDRAVRRLINAPDNATVRVGHVWFIRRKTNKLDALLIRLPSGRHLVYRYPRLERNPDTDHDEFTYMGTYGGAWLRLRAWPGKIAENITQAVARDIMADSMIALSRRAVPMIATVHDELIAEVEAANDNQTFAVMKSVMSRTPTWAPGLPMAAEGFIAKRYAKK